MLARPATMAAPPSTASPASWNPAVPPPPVTGAWVGTGLGEGLGDGLAEGEALWLADPDGVAEALSVAEEVAAVPLVAVCVAVPVGVPVADAVGVNVVTDEEGVPDDVQAEIATQASTVVRPQPTAVSLTRCAVHAIAVRAFIGPPHTPGNDHFPVAGRRNRRRNGKRVAGLWPLTGPAEELRRRKRRHHNGKPRLRRKHVMACPPGKY
jgi:hypothetical protein